MGVRVALSGGGGTSIKEEVRIGRTTFRCEGALHSLLGVCTVLLWRVL